MKNIIIIWSIFGILVSCKSTKQLDSTRVVISREDSVSIKESIIIKDSIIKLAADTAKLSLILSKQNLDTLVQAEGVSLSVAVKDGVLVAKAIKKEQNLLVPMTRIERSRESTTTARNDTTVIKKQETTLIERRIPLIYKIFAGIGLALVTFLAFKAYNMFKPI